MTFCLATDAAAGGPSLVPINSSVSTDAQSVRVNRNGTLEYSVGNAAPVYTAQPSQWIGNKSSTIGDSYEVRMVPGTSSFVGNVTNTWLAISSSREWIANGTPTTVTGTLQIRRAGTTNPMVSVSVSFTNT